MERWALGAGRWALGAGRWALGAGRSESKLRSLRLWFIGYFKYFYKFSPAFNKNIFKSQLISIKRSKQLFTH
jgi:hypothetical protein